MLRLGRLAGDWYSPDKSYLVRLFGSNPIDLAGVSRKSCPSDAEATPHTEGLLVGFPPDGLLIAASLPLRTAAPREFR
jgi:hypothetical protein